MVEMVEVCVEDRGNARNGRNEKKGQHIKTMPVQCCNYSGITAKAAVQLTDNARDASDESSE